MGEAQERLPRSRREIVGKEPPGIILTLAILSLEVPSIQLITSKRNVRKLCD